MRLVLLMAVACGLCAAGCNGPVSPAKEAAPEAMAEERRLRAIPPMVTPQGAASLEPAAAPKERSEAAVSTAATGDAPEVTVLDGFTGHLLWRPAAWKNANGVAAELRGGALAIAAEAGEHDKAALELAMKASVDLSRYRTLTFEARRTAGDEVQLAVGMLGGSYCESPGTALGAAWARVEVLLRARTFKAAPGWQHDSAARELDRIRAIYLVCYSAAGCAVEVRELRVGP